MNKSPLEELKSWIDENYKIEESITVHRLLVKIGTLRSKELFHYEEAFQRGKNQVNLQSLTNSFTENTFY